MANLEGFISESNRIEGIHRAVWPAEIAAHECLLARHEITPADLRIFVSAIAPGHSLRARVGLDVRVGNHIPPRGGPYIATALADILAQANADARTPWQIHCAYEHLHPFTDGNGRSGRALWLWQMQRHGGAPLGFLHHFYYQTLEAADG